MLGGEPLIMATVGDDYQPYEQRLGGLPIPQTYIRKVEGTYTAQAFITTDLDDNQITAFHPGAMQHSQENRVPAGAKIAIGIVAPDGRDGMIQHAAQFASAEIPFIFDPGQGLPMFSGDDLRAFIKQATWVTVNDYEWQLVKERTGMSAEEIASQVRALIITQG